MLRMFGTTYKELDARTVPQENAATTDMTVCTRENPACGMRWLMMVDGVPRFYYPRYVSYYNTNLVSLNGQSTSWYDNGYA